MSLIFFQIYSRLSQQQVRLVPMVTAPTVPANFIPGVLPANYATVPMPPVTHTGLQIHPVPQQQIMAGVQPRPQQPGPRFQYPDDSVFGSNTVIVTPVTVAATNTARQQVVVPHATYVTQPTVTYTMTHPTPISYVHTAGAPTQPYSGLPTPSPLWTQRTPTQMVLQNQQVQYIPVQLTHQLTTSDRTYLRTSTPRGRGDATQSLPQIQQSGGSTKAIESQR